MRLTIAHRLIIAFAISLLATMLVGGAAWLGLSRTSAASAKKAEMSADLAIGAETQQAMLMMRLAVKDFALQRSERASEAFDHWTTELNARVERSMANFQNPDRARWIREIKAELERYQSGFREVRRDLAAWERGITEELHPLNVKIRADITRLMMLSPDRLDAEADADVRRLASTYFNGVVAVKHYFAMGQEEDRDDASRLLGDASVAIGDLRLRVEEEDAAAIIASIERDLSKVIATFAELDATHRRGMTVLETELDVIGPQIAQIGQDIKDSLVRDVDEATLVADHAIGASYATIAAIAGVAAVLVAAIGVLLIRSILGPLRTLNATMRDIAEGEGDLTKTINASSKDELGDLARGFNTFTGKIRDLIMEVRDSVENVAAAATEISASSDQIADSLNRQRDQAEQVAAATEQMSASVGEVADAGERALTAAQESGDQATEGGQVVGKTIDEINGISDEVGRSADAIRDLGRLGEQIGQVIRVITDIADQTNLLALNAAIEAARAGEHGRGFAVVADEVRKLAERTQDATEEVGRSIQQIQSGTEGAVSAIDASSSRVSEGVELAGHAGRSLETIVRGSADVRLLIEQIAASSQQQAAAAAQVSQNIASIRGSTEESTDGAAQAATAASDLSARAETLRSLVCRFRV